MELVNAVKKQLVREFCHISQHLTAIYFTVKSKSRMSSDEKPGWYWAVSHDPLPGRGLYQLCPHTERTVLIKEAIILPCGNAIHIKGRSQPLLRPWRPRGYQRSAPPDPPPSRSNAARLRGDGPIWVTHAGSCFWTRSVFDLQVDLRANQRRVGVTPSRGLSSGVLLERWRRRACKFGRARRSFDR